MLLQTLCLSVIALSMMATMGLANMALTPTPEQTVIILLGPPASGKGTQAVRLSKNLKIPHISTGDLFRENISKGTPLGEKAKSFMDAGQLVPDALVLDMLFDRVSRPDCSQGYLLDGFPRTIPQAEELDKKLHPKTRLIVLNLDVSDETIIKRTAGRQTCTQCGNVHNLYFSPSKQPEVCDACGGKLIQRSDDRPEVVQERLRAYRNQTEPLIKFYKDKGLLHTVNGEQNPDKVYTDLSEWILQRSR